MVKITEIQARQVLDSRGNPTVECSLYLGNAIGDAMVPSGASTGIHEALELRDNLKPYGGKGVTKAVKNVHALAKKLTGKNFSTPADFDNELIKLDGTVNKAKYGVNAILGMSMAYRRAYAEKQGIPLFGQLADEFGTQEALLPMPFANVINGGAHAANDLEMQEFMIVPKKAKSFADATRMVAETYHQLKQTIAKKYGKDATNVGDEGGFAPPVKNAREALDLLSKAVSEAGYSSELGFAMDAAASEFYNAKSKTYLTKKLSATKLADEYEDLVKTYPLISLEDPFDQDDFAAWQDISKRFKRRKLQIVGDDLTVSNPTRVELAIQQKLCDALLLKVNQIGTITESMQAARLAEDDNWNVMVSHRSGETEDPFIADLSVGLASGQIKLGAPCRSDRVAKYNQLLRIEEFLGRKAKMSKW